MLHITSFHSVAGNTLMSKEVVGDNAARNGGAKGATGALTWLFFVLCKVDLVKITAASR